MSSRLQLYYMSATSVYGGAIWWSLRGKGRYWCNCR